MEQKELKYFADPQSSGLNGDDADFALPTNQVVNGENVRWGSTDKGATGWVESVANTRLLSEVQPSVTFITIGSVADTAKNRIYYFLYNQYTPDHKIMCWDDNLNIFYTVLLSTQVTGGLNFNRSYPIHSAKVEGDLLYWTDGNVSQKRINVEAAIRLNQPSYDGGVAAYVAPIAQSVITLIRRTTFLAPTATLSYDATKQNFIKLFAGQFAVRLITYNGEVSVCSLPSKMVNYRVEVANPSGVLTDNLNVITVELSNPLLTGDYIEQDIRKVQFLVRYDNNPNYFIINEWDKDNVSELAEINSYNSGGALSYVFLNDKIGNAISTEESVRSSDRVPVTSEGLEINGRRLFLANNVIGYDTPSTTSLTAVASTPRAYSASGDTMFKSYSYYMVGLRFRDAYKRACGIVTNNSLVVQIADRGDYDTNTFTEYINLTLNNSNALSEIPDWASYADIFITKNLRTRNFVQWQPNSIKYAQKNNDGTYTYQNNYAGNLFGVAFGTSSLSWQGYGQGVIFNEGDIVRVYLNGLSVAPFDLEVIGQDQAYIICRLYNFGNTTSISLPLTEYYTPYKPSDNELFYSTGITIPISGVGTSARQYSVLSGQITGDCWATVRQNIFAVTYYTESMSPNDNKWQSWFNIYGEASIVTTLGQSTNKSSIVWSDTFIAGTQSNGLSTFRPLNEKILPATIGAVRKIINTSKIEAQGGIMLAIGEDETASMYLGEVQTYGSDQRPEQVLAVDNVIGTVNVLRGNFGTINPESVTEYRGMVFWYDATNGRVIQYSQNGLYPISNYKMTRFWKLFSDQYNSMTAAEIEALGDRPFVFMTVDPYHDELLISIPKLLNTPPKGYLPDYPSTIYPFDVWDGQGKTMVFDLKSEPNRWMPPQTFVTENFITLQNKLFSFKSGQLYIHNQTTGYNQFYGVQNKSKLMFVCNQEPNGLKVYNNISIQNNSGNLLPSLTYFYVDNPYQQATDLVDFDWNNLEGVLYATLYRNKLVPTAAGYDTNGLLTAEKIRTNALKVMLQFDVTKAMLQYDVTTVPLQLRFVTVGYINSIGHNQAKI